MNAEQRQQALQQLTEALGQRRLLTPARILLDIVAPVGFLAGQAALFIQPLLPQGRWHSYVAALSDQQGWELLHGMIEQQEC